MSSLKNLTIVCLLFLVMLAVPAQAQRQTQQASDNGDATLRALLNEVRQLRIALERINVNTYRAQIGIQRLRAQQERVDRLRRDLDSVRNEISEAQLNNPRMEEMVKDIEEKMNAGVVDSTQYKVFKAEMDQQKQREQRLREREIQLQTELEVERINLIEMNQRLDDLERELSNLGSDDKPKEEGKRPPKN